MSNAPNNDPLLERLQEFFSDMETSRGLLEGLDTEKALDFIRSKALSMETEGYIRPGSAEKCDTVEELIHCIANSWMVAILHVASEDEVQEEAYSRLVRSRKL